MVHSRLSTLHRLILITLIIAAVIAVVMTGLIYNVVHSGIRQLEETVAEDCADRLELIIRAESETLQRTVSEWAVLNETRFFLSESNPGFKEKNHYGTYFNGSEITWLLIYNSTGSLRYGVGLDKKNQITQVNPDDVGRWLLSDQLIGGSAPSGPKAGLYPAGRRIFFLAVQPVTSPEENDPNQGTVVAVRELDETSLSRMTRLIPVSVRLTLSSVDGKTSEGMISPGQREWVYDKDTGTLTTNITLSDLLDRSSFSASMQIPFKTPYDTKMMFTLLGIILIGFGFFSIAIYYVFTRFFLRYITAIGQGLDMAALSGRPDLSVPSDFPPDIAPLAGSLNRVIVSLDEKQSSIIRSEHARKSVEIRWETLFLSAAEGILIGDDEGVLICNPRFKSLAGLGCEDLVGTPITDLPFQSLVGDGNTTLQQIWENPLGEGERFIWTITPGTDISVSSHVLDANLKFVEMNGRLLRFLIMRDITEEVRLRHEQEQAIRQIDKNLGQLAALNDDIRNPLTMISAWAELDNSPNRDKIMEGVRRINTIVDLVDDEYIASEKVRKFLQKSIDGYRDYPDSL